MSSGSNSSNNFWLLHAVVENQSSLFYEHPVFTRKENKEMIPTSVLTNWIDDYPYGAHRYGGSLPMCGMNRKNPLIVQSSHVWRQKNYAAPALMPHFTFLQKQDIKEKYDQESTKTLKF